MLVSKTKNWKNRILFLCWGKIKLKYSKLTHQNNKSLLYSKISLPGNNNRKSISIWKYQPINYIIRPRNLQSSDWAWEYKGHSFKKIMILAWSEFFRSRFRRTKVFSHLSFTSVQFVKSLWRDVFIESKISTSNSWLSDTLEHSGENVLCDELHIFIIFVVDLWGFFLFCLNIQIWMFWLNQISDIL